ncbi:hypothetical protein [Halorussus pelagicus]|nr:hypothetical protein [Halorussus pelagicus]
MKREGNELPVAFIVGGCTLIGTEMPLGWPLFVAGIVLELVD